MNLTNLTPHAIRIHRLDGEFHIEIQPSGGVARLVSSGVVTVTEEPFGITEGKVEGELPSESMAVTTALMIPVTRELGKGMIWGLPECKPHVGYIVSLPVRLALPERKDLFSPGELIRDDKGQPIGCKGLAAN